jgi:hypothetical protein
MTLLLTLEAHDLPLFAPELFSRGVSTWLGEAMRKRAVPPRRLLHRDSSSGAWVALLRLRKTDRPRLPPPSRRPRRAFEPPSRKPSSYLHVQLVVRAEELVPHEVLRDCRVTCVVHKVQHPARSSRSHERQKLQTPPEDETYPHSPTPLCHNAMGINGNRCKISLSSTGINPGGCFHCLGPQRMEARAPGITYTYLWTYLHSPKLMYLF